MLKKNLPIGGALVRIFEITDKNKVVIGISGINIDFDPEYNMLSTLLTVLIKLKTPARNHQALGNIEAFKNRIQQVRQTKLFDRSDPDIIALDNKISKMELAIDSLVSQLTF